jgi:hypothetical protein
VVGAAPHIADPTADVPVLAGPIPRPIRDFWTVHHVLSCSGHSIGDNLARNTLELFHDEPWSAAAKRLGDLPPDRFVHSVGTGDYDDYVLDLDVLDDAGNPTVACWAFKEWQVSEHQQYWDWLDSTGTDLLFSP